MAGLREPVIGTCGNCKRTEVALGTWGEGNERCHACHMYKVRHNGKERPEKLFDRTARESEMAQLKRRYGALLTNYKKLEEKHDELNAKYKKVRASRNRYKTLLEELQEASS